MLLEPLAVPHKYRPLLQDAIFLTINSRLFIHRTEAQSHVELTMKFIAPPFCGAMPKTKQNTEWNLGGKAGNISESTPT